MVPTTPGERIASLFAFVPDVSYADLDRAAGKGPGFAKQLARAQKAGPVAVGAFAPVFGVSTDWILYGRGVPPGKRAVRASVREAVGAVDAGKHAAPVRTA